MSNKEFSFEREVINGKPNPKYVDVLDEDKPIAGQKFVCMSFISPEKILKEKNMYFFEKFLKDWDIFKSMEKFVQFLNFISFKYNINFDMMMEDYKDFVKSENDNLITTTIEDDYANFLDKKEKDLQEKFDVEHKFQTNVRGVKVRGSFPTEEEAEMRAKLLRESDPSHDIFVGPIGMWMPLDPDAYKTGRVEYMNDELNELMHKKQSNEAQKDVEFEQRVKESKQKAIEDNIDKAEKSGVKLTQTIDEQGNLVGVNNMNTQENTFNNQTEVSSADIRKELFEGNDIVTDIKNDHGQNQLLSGPFAKLNETKKES
jgi:hypothetical protein